jgi:uncharacterized protein (TIGR03437 family)
MKRFAVFLFSLPLFADSTLFRAVLLPANELPALNNASRGVADIVASAVRDSSGQITSGTVDVLLRTTLPAADTATGLNLHNAPTGQSAPVAFIAGLTTANSRPLQSGADFIHIPIQIHPTDAPALALLSSLFNDPTRFYLNLTTTAQPNGLMRGQLQRAQTAVVMSLLDSANVVPAIGNVGSGVAQAVAIATRDANGNLTSGEVYLWATTNSNDATAFNGFHIHSGLPGTAGAIAITATLPPGAIPDITGTSQIGPVYTEVTVTNAAQAAAFNALFANPAAFYIDLHSVQNPNGIVRGPIRPTDRTLFSLLLDSANEVTPPSAPTQMPVALTIYTLRREDGSVAAATALCDLALRFPNSTQTLGLYVHDAAPLTDGPTSIKLTPDFYVDTGFGNYYAWTAPIFQLATVFDLLKNPENHYLNLHTFDDPSGTARVQFAALQPPPAKVAAAIAANLDSHATTLVPGGLASLFGTALVNVPADLSGWLGTQLPTNLNGAQVSIAGHPAPLLYVSPNQINFQVPLEVPAGAQTVTVDNGGGTGPAFNVTVAAAAPAIFFYPVPAILKNSNYSLVTSTNQARAGDVLLVFATGLGQTTPALTTGKLVPDAQVANTRTVTATIGGAPAAVTYSIASPGFTGLYQVAVTVPSGVHGSVPLEVQMGTAASNIVTIPVQ